MKPVKRDSDDSSDNKSVPTGEKIDVKDENDFLKGQLATLHMKIE